MPPQSRPLGLDAGHFVACSRLVISGERVIEFRDHLKWGNDTVVAIAIPDGGHWVDATVSINPRIGDIPVGLLVWAIRVAEAKSS